MFGRIYLGKLEFPIWSNGKVVTLRILDIHDFISDMVLLHTKNKAAYLKVANSVVHVYKDEGIRWIGLP